MSQYKVGTVSVTNASATVTGSGTSFLANVTAGDLFIRSGDGIYYFVANVASDTSLTLTAPYGGVTGSGASYVLHRDFITILGVSVPLMQDGDLETVVVYNRMVQAMFEAYGTTPNGTAAVADLTTSSTDTTAGRVTKTGDGGLLTTSMADKPFGTDFNSYETNGSWSITPTMTNGPDDYISPSIVFGTLDVNMVSSNAGSQLFRFRQVGGDNILYRTKKSGVWDAWQQLWHSGNLDQLTIGLEPSAGAIIAVGEAQSTTVARFYIPLHLVDEPASITNVGSGFDIRSAGTLISTGVTGIKNGTLSSDKVLAYDVTTTGLTSRDILTLRKTAADSMIVVTL